MEAEVLASSPVEQQGRDPVSPWSEQLHRLRDMVAARQSAMPPRRESPPAALAPENMVEQCERHGPWRRYLRIDGVLRAAPMCPACSKENTLRTLAQSSQIPARFASASFDTFKTSSARQRLTLSDARRYAQAISGRQQIGGLVFFGRSGTGKTHLAISLLRHCQMAGLSGFYVRAIDLMNRLRQTQGASATYQDRQVIENLSKVDVLIIDDVGKSMGTDFERAAMFNILDLRWGELLPTVMTSNLELEALRDLLTPAGFDRLTDAGSNAIELDWESERTGAMS